MPCRSSRALALLLLTVACGGADPDAAAAGAPRELFHDYGVIPHGQAAEHDFVVDTRAMAPDLVPLGVSADCSCARARMLLRAADGSEREATGQALAEFAARAGEVLVVRMRVETAAREVADLAPLDSKATLVLQPASDPQAQLRRYVPIRFRFGIDAPVRVTPFSILDFGAVPRSTPRSQLLALRSDLPGRSIRFGPVQAGDPRLQVSLEEDDAGAVLRARFAPDPTGPAGPFRDEVVVQTDLPDGYQVRIPVAGQVVPDLVAVPMSKVSLGLFDFAKDHPEQFVLVTDHDRSRAPEFLVAGFVDQRDRDVSEHFAVRLEPLDGDERTTRVWVRYLGGLQPEEFRGKLTLAKDLERGPFLPIDVVAFPRSTP